MIPRFLIRGLTFNKFRVQPQILTAVSLKRENDCKTRRLHLMSQRCAKIYMDRENVHAHQVLELSSKSYQLFKMGSDVGPKPRVSPDIVVEALEKASVGEMFELFKSICDHCRETNTLISHDKYRDFVQKYCDLSHKLNDSQLKESLWALSLLPEEDSVRSPNFMQLWNALDVECCRRVDKWNTDELLLICDAWYRLNLARICEFVWEALRKLGRKVLKMKAQQLVQTMFLCNVMRRSVLDMFDFEANLSKCAKEMTLPELGVMSMGFFKTQTPIRNPDLIIYLYQRLMDELNTVDDITFVAILKVLRYSSKLPHVDLMMQLLVKISEEKFEQMNLLTALHVALLGCDLQCCHDPLLEKIITKYCNEIGTARLKDLERISFAMALFNIHTPHKIEEILCGKILDSLHHRIEEIMKYPKCFTNCLHFLTLRGYYDPEMLSSALDKKFLKHAVGSKLAVSRDIFHLDTFVKINLHNQQYEGNQLEDKNRKVMGKMLTQYIPERFSKFKLNATDNKLLQIKEATDTFLPHNQLMHVLPNYERSDVVVCYDRSELKSVAIAESCPEHYSGVILTRDHLLADRNHENIDTIVIVIAGWNNVVRGKDRNTCLLDMKLKQLQMLDHKPVVIYWHELQQLTNHRDRIQFVKGRISTILNL